MILLTSTDSLEVFLDGAVATNELEWATSWQDARNGFFESEDNGQGVTAGAAAVAIVAAPGASVVRRVGYISVSNADTARRTVTIDLDVSATPRQLWTGDLEVGQTVVYSTGAGWQVTP